jgi:uncharacterized protein
MEVSALIHALSDATAYPSTTERVEVRQTHISAVFLAGNFVYKIKKPVDFGFLNFSTLNRRKYFCQEEVRLNTRLAPGVYHGVVPVTREGGQIRVEGTTGEIIEWAVKMDRLCAEDVLEHRLLNGAVTEALGRKIGCRIAEFHKSAGRSSRIA